MIKLTTHAAEMIEEREIALTWVEAAIVAPEWTDADPHDPALTRSYRSTAEAGGRVLRVVHRAEGADVLVITAHFDRGAKR